jgi:hypothetical protein
MIVADILYFGAIAGAMLFSSVVLLRQFLRGDLTEGTAMRWRYTSRRPRRRRPQASKAPAHRGPPSRGSAPRHRALAP